MLKRLLWAPHNLIAHPLMTFLPEKWAQKLHDWTIPNETEEPEITGPIPAVDDDTETMQ